MRKGLGMPRFARTPLPKPNAISAEIHAALIVRDALLRSRTPTRRFERDRRRERPGIGAVSGLDRRVEGARRARERV